MTTESAAPMFAPTPKGELSVERREGLDAVGAALPSPAAGSG